jgi:hypothetical protein
MSEVVKKSLTLKLPKTQIEEWDVVCKKLGLSKTQMVSQLLDDILPLFRDEKNMLSSTLSRLGKSISDISDKLDVK